MLMIRAPMLFVLTLQLPLLVHAHTVQLGTEIVRGACPVIENRQVRVLSFFSVTHSVPQVAYRDGQVNVTAIVIPSQALPGQIPDDPMTSCSHSAWGVSKGRNPNSSSVTPEEHFRSLLNSCLDERHAKYKANVVVLRRTSVVCKDPVNN